MVTKLNNTLNNTASARFKNTETPVVDMQTEARQTWISFPGWPTVINVTDSYILSVCTVIIPASAKGLSNWNLSRTSSSFLLFFFTPLLYKLLIVCIVIRCLTRFMVFPPILPHMTDSVTESTLHITVFVVSRHHCQLHPALPDGKTIISRDWNYCILGENQWRWFGVKCVIL